MNLNYTIFFQVAPALSIAMIGGCVTTPPDPGFADAVALAGIEPIRFVSAAIPTDVDAGENRKLTVEDAVRRALANDPIIQAAIADVRGALADARQARHLPNPVINVAVRFPEGGGKTVIEAGLAADLVSLLARPRRISAADHRLRAASAEALTAVLDRLTEVQDRYAAVQALDAQSVVLNERQTIIQRLLDMAKARLEAGESSRLDVITLDAERVSLDIERTQTASAKREQRLVLARLVGQPSGPAEWELTPWSPLEVVVTNEVSWVRAAMDHRPEIQAGRWELAALGDEAALTSFAALDGADVGVEGERDGDWSIGPAFSTQAPVLDWGRQRRAKADAQRIAARHRLTQTRQQVVEEVRRAVESLKASQSAVRQVQAQLIPLSEQRVEHAEAAYANGLADMTAVLLAQQQAQAARSKLIESQQSASSALYRLHRAVGGPGIAAAIATTSFTTTPTTATASE